MKIRHGFVFLVLVALVLSTTYPVHAQSGPACVFQADGSIVCTTGGEGNNGGGEESENAGNNEEPTCQPGDIQFQYALLSFDPATSTCTVMGAFFACGGQLVEGGEITEGVPCSTGTTANHPCTTFTVSAGGITCENTEWRVSARVAFPEIYLDLRPYPATLVRWPTAIRNGGLPESSGSGGVDYIPYGGGSPNHPQEGDWQDLRLILTLRPAGPMFVTLPHIGDLILPSQGATGSPTMIKWEVPSHPAAGGGPVAGSVGGLDELPGDMPLFVGSGRAPYKLYWELHYYVYEAVEGCVAGPGGNGNYNCGGGTGHRDIVGHDWKRSSSGGEIPPSAVQNLPVAVMADINHDGTPDAYWDNNLTLRRMDDNNNVNNPIYQRFWNWGGMIYWAVREGQGQIGWPGE